jgi:esterase/lipase superfamily enzyme
VGSPSVKQVSLVRHFLILLCIATLTACTPRGSISMIPETAALGPVTSVYVGTTRKREADGSFGGGRSETVQFANYDIAIPPNRALGEISWPKKGRAPDPAQDFLTTNEVVYQQDTAFRADLSRALAAQGREAVIYIHGYNNTFSEGLYRIAQLSHDLEIPGVAVHYSWPSAAEPLGYVYDRDSALFARDGLEALIREVAQSGASRITLVAHSMGAGLTMEALRQISVRDGGRIMRQINGVILLSPDIDVDVFRMQAKDIGKLPQPFLIFGSDRDRMLRLSGLITGQSDRLGSLNEVSRLADLDVTYMDVAAFSEGAGHFVPGTSAALISILARINDINSAYGADRAVRAGLLPGVVLNVRQATRVILYPVAEITGQRLQ